MFNPYSDDVLSGYQTDTPELQNLTHGSLVSIIEGLTPASEEVRVEAVEIFNSIYPDLPGYDTSTLFDVPSDDIE